MSVATIWQLILPLMISSAGVFSADDHVCPRTENYTVTSMETYTEPVIVNTFTWCLQIPPRCPKTRTETRLRYRLKTETKTRSVNECCEGYKMITTSDSATGIRCLPICEKCQSGVCVTPHRCLCSPGYDGNNCTTECPAGTWGTQCKEKCDCAEDVSCNPVNGHCACSSGLRGRMCNETCPSDRWGPECRFPCECENSRNTCHPETGRCFDNEVTTENESYPGEPNEDDVQPVDFTTVDHDRITSQIWETTERPETVQSNVIQEEDVSEHQTHPTTDNPGKTTGQEVTSISSSDQLNIKTRARSAGTSSTARPVIVLVSVPERRRNVEIERGKFTITNPYLGHIGDNVNLHDIVHSKTDYVKNIHKADDVQPTPIPLDVSLIVIASIVSLGLTSVAVVMVLHMRSKLLETARISIYEEAKSKSQENPGATRISSIVTSTVPQPPGVSPLFVTSTEPRSMFPVNSIDPASNYANGTATLGFRVSGDLRGFLQNDHYDRPPSTRIHLQNDFDANTEHVYDEIPLQSSPLHCHKNS